MSDRAAEDLVSIIVITYNRAHTLMRALKSILAQTYPHIDLVVVDDGSTDETASVLARIADPRMRVFSHEKNRGITAARNTGLDNIRGKWFTFVDSDDEIVPEAIETLLRVPREVDPAITHVECNGVVFGTDQWTGVGLTEDQYLDEEKVVSKMKFDHWGMFICTALGQDRFNESLPGFEDLLWSKLRDRTKGYYIHTQLKIVHREGAGRVSQVVYSPDQAAHIYHQLLNERSWFAKNKKYKPDEFVQSCMRGEMYTLAAGDKESARRYREMLRSVQGKSTLRLAAEAMFAGGPLAARAAIHSIPALKSMKGWMRRVLPGVIAGGVAAAMRVTA